MKTERIPLTDLVAETLAECVDESGLTRAGIARRLGISPAKLTDILKGRRRLTAEMAERIGRLFGTTATYWLSMQTDQDLRKMRAEKADVILREVVPLER
ncbi:MAG TPA: HigA family addiction module antitoxin [Verrucomicrobiales bacterium]|jgi:addiction module HigA family antidote|nr:HigA family addiction module antitoxin [Verrucomicrobiales bacterium]